METNRALLSLDDVVTVHGKWNYMPHQTFRTEEFIKKLARQINADSDCQNEWCFEGVECEVLSPKQPWRKGKIRITVEFLPDSDHQGVSDLDGLRQVVLE